MPSKTKTTGGARLREMLRKTRRNAGRIPVIDVGFLDRQIGNLAARLEFGDPSSNLPERPAFRQGIEDLHSALPGIYKRVLASSNPARDGIGMSNAQAVQVGLAAVEVLRASYLRFQGPGLSVRQERRKEGTAGAGLELVGHRGPRLLGHLEMAVDGQRIGG